MPLIQIVALHEILNCQGHDHAGIQSAYLTEAGAERFCFITVAPLCLQLHASEQSGLTLHPHAGVLTSGNIKDFGQDTGFGLGIGYQFNE